jgi:tRNA acetyltransferase TAN1
MPKVEGRKKGGYHKNEIKGGFTLESGTQGFLVTHHRNKERGATSEIMNLFERQAELIFGEEDQKQSKIIEDDLEAELKKLKSKERRLFGAISTGIDCTLFIRCNPKVEPVSFVHSLMKRLSDSKSKHTRFCSRIIPFTNTCFAAMRDIIPTTKNCIGNLNQREPTTYAISIKIRNNTKLDRDEMITSIAALVDSKHTVNLKDPTYTIVVEVLNHVFGISVVTDYNKFKKFNLEQLNQV